MSESMVAEKVSRVIGLVEGIEEGPRVVAIGGMHGNEPAGVEALQQVMENLKAKQRHFKGKLLALRGNIPALQHKVRYIDEDMNRIWFPSIIEKVRRRPKEQLESNERRQMKDLLDILDAYMPGPADQPTIFADLHSFSAEGNMFAITARKKAHIHLFARLHVPLIFGIEKTLRGTALSYYQEQGYVTFALEGGQHQNEVTVKNSAAAILAMLDEVGCINTADLPAFEQHGDYLAEQNKKVPGKVELVYQHMIEPEDRFRMRPGYRNFQTVKKGEWLANDREGKIRAQCDGYLLMPLYQQQGNDGFFIARTQKDG